MAHQSGVKNPLEEISPVFPHSVPADISSVNGTLYTTAQTLVQQVAYTLSDKLFTYSPDTFSLDEAARLWSGNEQTNVRGVVPTVNAMETRLGAANVLLGYVFSPDVDPKKKAVAKSIIASSPALIHMRSALDQLSVLYGVSSPFVAHVSAVDYEVSSAKLVTDYASAVTVAQETGIGLLASFSAHEAQHMALFATLAATVLPMVHIYDGVSVSRESAKIKDVLDRTSLQNVFSSILGEQKEAPKKADQGTKVNAILRGLNAELGTAYSLFEYEGHDEPDAVLVTFGSVESLLATQVAASLTNSGERIGVIAIRVYRPFSEPHFLEALPRSVKRIAVLGQVANKAAAEDSAVQSALYVDVVAAITMSDIWTLPPPIVDIPEEELTAQASTMDAFILLGDGSHAQQYVFWDGDDAASAPAASIISRLLSEDPRKSVSFQAAYDNVPLSGILHSEIRASSSAIDAPFHIECADISVVNDIQLLSKFDIASRTKDSGIILLKSTIKDDEFEKKLPALFRRAVTKKAINLIIADPSALGDEAPAAVENALIQLAFAKLANISAPLEKLSYLNIDSSTVHQAYERLDSSLRNVEIPKEWADSLEDNEPSHLPTIPQTTSFAINEEKHTTEPAPALKTSQSAAQAIVFKEAYDVQSALRPDLSMKNYIVKVQENRRLTPEYYGRNIFHIEFDLSGTGMEYQIGEALGIHSQNDPDEVSEFIEFYGLNADDIVEVPSKDDPDVLEMRTVFQALSQNVDIFGRPPKKFYESLAEFATDEGERKALLTLSSAEGATESKRRAEMDTVTFADILAEYKSAHPSFYELVRIVSPLKRREYSIASSQKVNPNSVHLLIVVVNWVDTKGRDRFGQATRYLSRLPIGAKVTVSVKPSVMKLPPLATQPLIMAGLGTGLAPFRAFVQYRAWQKSQGVDIGSVLLYMGSRHQREEYLYGEEWEAYQAAGIVTLLGRAFSRDQSEKIYIQDRMRQSLDDIIEAYIKEDGAFYLCGPTWPVPDVTEVLQEAIVEEGKRRGAKVDGAKKIEELKEGLRYVLEVY
ncbi:unnamed protein product [Tuber melanosporum]|uniref:assimilatory sulfite reductase (NADPH) n=1 Tax=Tuber melanosporum (strain Mel28) TaxID=656061 RepID=D5GC71_TUBMM|nr:uncharacterized protein GSTUM_00000610001 [Tuber melanosporum]CAZ82114.1 unnamed protein product [Tuber melanosporum]